MAIIVELPEPPKDHRRTMCVWCKTVFDYRKDEVMEESDRGGSYTFLFCPKCNRKKDV